MNKDNFNLPIGTILRVVAVFLGLWFLYLIRDVLALFFISIIIMAAIDPVVSWLKLKVKFPRVLGVLIIYLILISILVGIFSFLVPVLMSQFRDFLVALPGHLQKVDNFLKSISFYGQSYGMELNLTKLSENLGDSSFNVFSTTVGFFSSLISLVVVFSMAFYMSIHQDGMENFLESVSPKEYRELVVKLARKIKLRIGRWMSGQLVLMLTIFLLDFIILYFLDVPYALVIALISGFLEIIPYIGPTIAASLATLIAILVSPVKAIFVLFFYVLVHQVESNIIVPQIMKKAVGLNPLAVILSMLIGLKVAGVLGAILAVPVATAVGVIFREIMRRSGLLN